MRALLVCLFLMMREKTLELFSETNIIMIGKRETGLTRVLFMILKMNG